MTISPSDVLASLQIVDLTRNQPSLKAVHDFHLKALEDHAKDLMPKPDPTKVPPVVPKITLPPERVNTNLVPSATPVTAQPSLTPDPHRPMPSPKDPPPPQRRMGEEVPLTSVRSPDGPPEVTVRRPGGSDAS